MKRRSSKSFTGLIFLVVILTISLLFLPNAALAVEYSFTSFSYPNASSTLACGINDAGQIVGAYISTSSGGYEHGFLYSAGNFTSIDYPNVTLTQADGINDAGQIVGTYRSRKQGESLKVIWPGLSS